MGPKAKRMSETKDIDYQVKIVAYLDILGFKRLVFQSRNEASRIISDIDAALIHSLKCLELEGGPDWFSVKLFSDCFCLSCEDVNSNMYYILSEISYLQWYLSTCGIFISGGLSTGPHFENERIIFSEGLINAYELQHHDPFPRVLIADSLVHRIFNEPLQHYKDSLKNYLIIGPDGRYFLDYIQGISEYSDYGGDLDLFLEAHKDAILKQVQDNNANYSVLDKYKWVADYHNFKFNELFKQEDWDDSYFSELKNKLLIPMTYFPSFCKENLLFQRKTETEDPNEPRRPKP